MDEEQLAKEFEKKLSALIAKMQKMFADCYTSAEIEMCLLAADFDWSVVDKIDINRYPAIKERFNEIIEQLHQNTYSITVESIYKAFALSNLKNDKLIHGYFKGLYGMLSDKIKGIYNKENERALQSFIQRKTNGMNLSERVWKYDSVYKGLIEDALQIGIGNGISHKEMGKFLMRYLKNPSATIYEVDTNGIANQIPNPTKPKAGVYANPQSNARRLARTEINMAYRNADVLRWQQQDFVVGYEVHLSHNHTTRKGKKIVQLVDICDDLEGEYPKDFMFTGWHPQCRCYITPILKTPEERAVDDELILDGKDIMPPETSVNYVGDVPPQFKAWLAANRGRLAKSKSLPYFVRYNPQYCKIK